MFRECLLSALVEVEIASAGACSVGPAAVDSPARRVSIEVVVTIVGRRHFVVGMLSSRVEFLSG